MEWACGGVRLTSSSEVLEMSCCQALCSRVVVIDEHHGYKRECPLTDNGHTHTQATDTSNHRLQLSPNALVVNISLRVTRFTW